ncbi:MAG: UDP-N-acetylglucosamine 1-carboxyvinyltransferase [Deltaproteobacteria bacterium]|nr:UDP-N-acetylglucosamine 1-carboxyvinyltransferase [Deltaproteobacteria bacterium]
MDHFRIHGGIPLHGTVTIGGAKNAALPMLSACVLTPQRCVLHGVPRLHDVDTMLKLLTHVGVQWERNGNGGATVNAQAEKIAASEAPYTIVKTMRASSMILGPLLARTGHARVSLPGGCAIGARPMDQHLKAFKEMGAEITIEEGNIAARADRLRGVEITFDMVTVTGTENVMMAAVLAEGQTILNNAAREPEVVALAEMLSQMGARVVGAGTARITIDGVEQLHGTEVTIIPDRIQAGTYLIAAAMTNGDVAVENCPLSHLEALQTKLTEAGARIEKSAPTATPTVRVVGPRKLRSVDITTAPFPGYATDLQAQWMAAMTIADGASAITETIFENRFMHVAELRRMGAEITVDGHTAIVKSVAKLSGAPLMATDLRASASLVLAALAAEGQSDIQRVYHIDRGYERIEEQLYSLGARIERVR